MWKKGTKPFPKDNLKVNFKVGMELGALVSVTGQQQNHYENFNSPIRGVGLRDALTALSSSAKVALKTLEHAGTK